MTTNIWKRTEEYLTEIGTKASVDTLFTSRKKAEMVIVDTFNRQDYLTYGRDAQGFDIWVTSVTVH